MSSAFARARNWLDLLATSAMLVASVVLLWGSWKGSPVVGSTRSDVPAGDISGQELRVTLDPLQRAGTLSAQIVVIEFADFECPFCATYARTTFPQVRSSLIDRGLASYAFMHFPLDEIHKQARRAATAAVCAARQGKFWEMHEALFSGRSAVPDRTLWSDKGLGPLNAAKFDECMTAGTEMVSSQVLEGQRLGVKGTPTFFVGETLSDGQVELKRRLEGAVSFEVLQGAVKSVADAM
jgi:protein-disulfide isomerase